MTTSTLLVIGIGNPTRGDDAVGPAVAEAVTLRWPGRARVLDVHQLTPELVQSVAEAGRVVFVDADTAATKVMAVKIRPVVPCAPASHRLDPEGLLALADQLFAASPDAWLVSVPAMHLEFGIGLSPIAARSIEVAASWIATHFGFLPSEAPNRS